MVDEELDRIQNTSSASKHSAPSPTGEGKEHHLQMREVLINQMLSYHKTTVTSALYRIVLS